jgi:hypothetical protein
VAIKTYYVGSGNDGNFGALFDGAPQAAASRADGWTVAKLTSGNNSDFDAGTKQTSATFAVSVKPTTLLLGTTANAFKTPAALTGVFAAGTWNFTFAVRATVASSQAGSIRIRIFRSANADGSAATELTTGAVVGSNTAALSTTADVTTTLGRSLGAVTLSNEFLFFAAAWGVASTSGSNSADVVIRTGSTGPAGSWVDTPDFTVSGGGSTYTKSGYAKEHG